ncbi:MAG: hypothetical protein M1838_002661 [Thelocarpon superellum]|nr:MAG: hypothetical protein M1838_002661 [Thelocarpon superellum]
MPPRKSDASKAATGDEATPVKERGDGVNVEDLNLPRTMVQRLAKGVLPPNTQISKDALLAMSKSATVFVNFITAHANDNTVRQNKKTVMPKDVLEAIETLEFRDFLPRLEAELAKYNEVQTDKRNNYRKKLAADKAPAAEAASSEGATLNGNGEGGAADGDSPPAAKKARISTNGAGDTNGVPPGAGADDDPDQTADDTISDDEDADADGADELASDDEVADGDGEEVVEDDTLETREPEPPDDEALDNGEDSD